MSNGSKFDFAEFSEWAYKMSVLRSIWIDILEEHTRQEEKFPGQHHPDGTGSRYKALADLARSDCQAAADLGECTWLLILREEVYEAFAETDPVKLRAELIQSLAVMVHWVQDIDSRGKESE